MSDLQRRVIADFRANRGQVGGHFTGMPLLLLTTIGARSGRPRTVALTYLMEAERYFVAAAAGGTRRNPDWYHNVVANPMVTVEVGAETFEGTATVATGLERDAWYDLFAARHPQLTAYQARTQRQIPIVALSPRR